MEGRPLEERELVLRAQRGDDGAFAELVRAHQEIAFRVAYLITGSSADAEDAVQDGALKAWRALGRFRVGEPWRPWLLSIVANEARNRRRSAGRRAQLALRASREQASGDAAPFPGSSTPEAAALAEDERRRLLAALESLPEEARERARVPLPAGALRGGDRGGARPAPRHRQVAHVARARPAEGVV